jgi:DNA-binding response OmpR family regulator
LKKILVVDDNRDITYVVQRMLEKAGGFAVDSYNDPRQALTGFKTGYYDLLILDVRMPRMDGFELLAQIRKFDPCVKACFLTSFEIGSAEFKEMVPPSLAVECLIKKPVGADELLADIRRMID